MTSNFSDKQPDFCPECSSRGYGEPTLAYKEGGYTKAGKQYNAFWGCPNFKEAEIKCQYTWRPARSFERKNGNGNQDTAQKQKSALIILNEILMEQKKIKEALNALNERLDAMETSISLKLK